MIIKIIIKKIIINNEVINMKFYDRESELNVLETLNKRRPSFIVITGRRRVGKTELIKQFIKGKNALYFFVDAYKSLSELIDEYAEYIVRELSLPSYIKISKAEEFLEFIFTNEIVKNRQLIIVFDEFQRFLKINPSFIMLLQKFWDLYKNDTNIYLIISGSSIGMIRRIFLEEKAPLFKRADNIITLRDFSFWEICRILDDLEIVDPIEKLKIFGLFGGTIFYYTLLEKYNVKSFEDALNILILNDYAPLRNEVKDIFIEEFGKVYRTYFEIISAIARGRVSRKEIADIVKIKESSLSPYLYDLSEILNLVEYRVPITDDIGKSKRGRYFLTNNFIKFWFKFIYPNRSLYEIGRYEQIKRKILSEWNSFIGFVFEEIARDFIKRKYGSSFEKIGAWWDRKGNEIDIVCINQRTSKICFIEVKWSSLTYSAAIHVINRLREKSKYLSIGFKDVCFGIIAKSISEKDKLKEQGYLVFDFEDIYNLAQ